LRRMLLTAGLALIASAVLVTVAVAAKPGPGSSTGRAAVFVSNPVEDLGNQNLTDQKDSASAVPAAAYHTVTLTDLDGSGFLRGRWAEIIGETGNPAYSPTNTFIYNRSQDEFEQVMAYFWITESQKYIQSLGFGTGKFRPVNMEPQRLRINQYGADNSFATTHKDEIRLGKGGVDDAEDGEVINHEYGHAIHFSQNFSFASEQAGAIKRGLR
jgi:zinc metalloprotease ZmpB